MIVTHSENLRYQTSFSNGKQQALADTAKERGGSDSGFGPFELLEAALAS
jgi:uncharacterized OsmC-like protein